MAESTRDYDLCGWRLASAIDLPELPRWSGPVDADVAIRFRLGEVPERLDAPRFATPVLQIDATGRALYHIANVATYLIERGATVTVAPLMPPDSPDVRLFLLGSVFGFLCHQRGVLPLHAASVEIDGKAVAFAGPSGAGKSTLAAAFLRRGFRLLSDDVAPLVFGPDGPRILPGLRRIRLWGDSARAADWRPGEMERCRAGLEKFSRGFDTGFVSEPLAPAALFHLAQVAPTVGGRSFRRLKGKPAMHELRRQTYRWRSLTAIAGTGAAIARAAEAAGGIPRHFVLARPFDYDQLDATIDAVVETVRLSR